MSMMAMGWVLAVLMIVVLLSFVGVVVAMRVLGEREVADDHPGGARPTKHS